MTNQPTLIERLTGRVDRLNAMLATCESPLHAARVGCVPCQRDTSDRDLLLEAIAALDAVSRRGEARPQQRNLPDDVLLEFWRSVQGPHAGLTGPLIRFAGLVYVASRGGECRVPPAGWWCSREAGHDGPCAARPIPDGGEARQEAHPLCAECGTPRMSPHHREGWIPGSGMFWHDFVPKAGEAVD